MAGRAAVAGGGVVGQRQALSTSAGLREEAGEERIEPADAESLMQIGTRRILSAEHDEYRRGVRAFFQDQVAPFHDEWEAAGQVPRELWTAAGEAGLLGVGVPEAEGGVGADIRYSAVVWEEQSYSNCSGPGFALHSDIVLPYLVHYGTAEQKAKYVPPMITGEAIGAIAMTEPNTGSDLQGVATKAVQVDDDTFKISGSKTYITNGALADTVIVVTRTGQPDKRGGGLTLFVVEDGMKGFSRGRKLKKMGLHAQDTSELVFEDVLVSKKEHMLGQEGGGFYHLMTELPQERLIVAGAGIAAAEAAYEWTRAFVNERKAFGQQIKRFQALAHRLAEVKTNVVIGRTFVDSCLELHAQGRFTSQMASMAKYWATDLQNEVVDVGVQMHGGAGFMEEYPICKAYRDARVQPIYAGTNEMMKELIARTI
ncbi:acyl-Coenzyme A dehydrogenase [Thecamonas trahens ATCC 50062]|uniref:Acyl-Coenzyme A dehydrogenase n=1 Tax=Thecamonas trahens ATCC 50062 TaxID=461836 RepID=A0A0L0D7M6_THETB|nr:acyl-Coenzyme A dehydrogenase [Thecamonas trahens ATCC 50062]KNC48205.1 acyl-Coenzyme A dehydrogenase [Thecamonas trahens ATCC 50062]|eukprot:XP_013758774.1 acyl-Coenzyme A dehydrogenase [Thecamonas trahens ATCC 50062]